MPSALTDPPAAGPLRHHAPFGFSLARDAEGWRWQAFDTLGRRVDHGVARTRAQAAALLIRALART